MKYQINKFSTIQEVVVISLLLGGNQNQSSSNNSQKDNSVENKEIDALNLSHNLPLLANNNDSQTVITNATNPDSTTRQSILSIPNTAGTTTEPNDNTEILPNKVDSALNSDLVSGSTSYTISYIQLLIRDNLYIVDRLI